MRILLLVIIIVFSEEVFSQDIIEWDENIQLTFQDYQSSATEINETLNNFSISTGAFIEFSFAISYGEFMFTKNFNAKVHVKFNKKASYISAPSLELAEQLVKFGQLEFDLTELSARKFRKKLFESKGAFSNTDFFQPLYNEIIAEQQQRHKELAKSTEMGQNEEVLKMERTKILNEIAELADYCKTCKPPKKKRRNK